MFHFPQDKYDKTHFLKQQQFSCFFQLYFYVQLNQFLLLNHLQYLIHLNITGLQIFQLEFFHTQLHIQNLLLQYFFLLINQHYLMHIILQVDFLFLLNFQDISHLHNILFLYYFPPCKYILNFLKNIYDQDFYIVLLLRHV